MSGLALFASITDWPLEPLALAIGVVSAIVTSLVTWRALRDCEVQPGFQPVLWGVLGGGLAAGLAWACYFALIQETPDVRPSALWWRLKPAYQAVLLVLLVAATATDLKTYYILDWVTAAGMGLGVLGAALAGDVQLCHLWVDWNAEVPQLKGPDIPSWLSLYPHLHGLAWSLSGLIAGAGVTWAARGIASLLLGQEALGFGDVTLMGMIGAFLGWQPVLIVFLIAPLCALVTGLIVRSFSSKTYVPYGPYLSLAAVLVLFNWSRIWMFEIDLSRHGADSRGLPTFALRRLFGDWVGLLILAGMLLGGLILLLGGWRLYLSLPVASRRTASAEHDKSEDRDGP
ncbi:MAG: prepilin peptidase [Planctomycetaceae bacterium]